MRIFEIGQALSAGPVMKNIPQSAGLGFFLERFEERARLPAIGLVSRWRQQGPFIGVDVLFHEALQLGLQALGVFRQLGEHLAFPLRTRFRPLWPRFSRA